MTKLKVLMGLWSVDIASIFRSERALMLKPRKMKIQKDLQYQEGFLNIVRKKLSNERFISGAPEKVIEIEKNKEQDAVAKIAILKEKLTDLG